MDLPEGLRFDDYEPVRIHIVNFIKDYVKLAGVSRAVLGLSGGIDSSLVAALACEAIGSENVLGIILPVDAKKDAKNIADAKLVAETLDMPHEIFELKKAVAAYDTLNLDKVARGNLTARLRMVTWYARANQENRLVLGTGNKTELMIGYFTKYGDAGSDALPIGELYKANVRDLSHHIGIPEPIIKKAPSAGLWEGQTDEKEIGISYDYLDSILFLHLEKGMSEREIVEWGIDESKVLKVMEMKSRTQHKRDPLPRPNLRLVTKHEP
ncbi:MAG: NAD+ synthase [Candidatus Thorarchaeota archaeon]|nr:NAD+ synthase [Candidatus Thorarchaeota archaeon]